MRAVSALVRDPTVTAIIILSEYEVYKDGIVLSINIYEEVTVFYTLGPVNTHDTAGLIIFRK